MSFLSGFNKPELIKMNFMCRKILWLNLLVILTTCTQVIYSSPKALSAVDLSSSPIDYLHWLCLCPMVAITLLLIVLNWLKARSIIKIIAAVSLMAFYWLFVNHSEFKDRVAAWSTFSDRETWYYVLHISGIPVVIAAAAFAACFYVILNFVASK